MNYISENDLKAESEYMQLFGCDRHSFEAGARWAEKILKYKADKISKEIREGENTNYGYLAGLKRAIELIEQP